MCVRVCVCARARGSQRELFDFACVYASSFTRVSARECGNERSQARLCMLVCISIHSCLCMHVKPTDKLTGDEAAPTQVFSNY